MPSAPDGHGQPDGLQWEQVDDDELVALALSSGPEAVGDDDAVPLDEYLGRRPGLLPAWYMPRPLAAGGPRWRAAVAVGIVAAFLVLEALGLCSTFGGVVPG
jgi:hypothetical protein